jgi:hypothetical protein
MEKGLVFGLSIGELLEIYDHDSQSWKMSGCLFTGDYAKCLGALRKSGIMRNGRTYEQATWAHRTGGKESGLWLTPNCMDALPARSENALRSQYEKNRKGRTEHSTLREQIAFPKPKQMWPTPQQRDYKGKSQRGADPENRDCLPNAIHGTGQLNPQFVEWMMGYPLNYTDTRDGLRLSLTRE